jgi:predicted RNA methylase
VPSHSSRQNAASRTNAAAIGREKLRTEIAARAPWYQRIEFPGLDLATTDEAEWRLRDGAPDNQVDGVGGEEAERTRPFPKWRHIEKVLPEVQGLEVLEVGSNCGFFSFEFARRGASRVVGLDVAPKWIENAEFCARVLGLEQVSFRCCDFMTYSGEANDAGGGLLGSGDAQIVLPNDRFDLAFMSTVLDHTFFPFLAIYKMLRIARGWIVIDSPILEAKPDQALLRQSYPPDLSHHANVFTSHLLVMTLVRFGIPREDIQTNVYNAGRSMTLVAATGNMADRLRGA